MKSIFTAILLGLISTSAFADANFYQCSGFGGNDEYMVGINLNKNTAGFFDNDSTSYMKLVKTVSLESNPPQLQMTFEGKEATYEGTLKLVFNATKLKAYLYSYDPAGNQSKIGEATCEESEPWNE